MEGLIHKCPVPYTPVSLSLPCALSSRDKQKALSVQFPAYHWEARLCSWAILLHPHLLSYSLTTTPRNVWEHVE